MSLETEQIIALIRALQEQALESQRREADLRKTIQDLAIQVAAIQIAPVQTETPPIKVYKPVDITGSVRCDETLDAVKCLPDFYGDTGDIRLLAASGKCRLTICSGYIRIVRDTIRP